MKNLALATSLLALLAIGCGNDGDGGAAGGGGSNDTSGTIDKDTGATDTGSTSGAATDTGSSSGAVTDTGSSSGAATDTGSSSGAATDTGGSSGAATDAGGSSGAADTSKADAGGSHDYTWFQTCGDPVCSGWKAKDGGPLCNGEKVGDGCGTNGGKCDPKNGCNALLLCTDKDPKAGPGGCPISQRVTKEAIRYLDAGDERRFAEELYGMKLATWRYRQGDGRTKLGIIIEDAPQSVAIDGRGDRVDLYSYTSLAIAALKAQKQQIAQQQARLEQQQRQIDALRGELAALRAGSWFAGAGGVK